MALSNLTPETATEVLLSQLPYITTLNVFEDGVFKTVYYKITNNLTHDAVITFWFYGTPLGSETVYYKANYEGYADVILDDNVFDAFPDAATEVPIKVDASYWIEVHKYGSGTTSPILNINISLKPYSTTFPVGQIVIFSASVNNYFLDKGGLHTGLVDPTLGQIVNFIPFFPATEHGDVLANGTYLITDNSWITKPDPPDGRDNYLLLLDPSFNIITRALFHAPAVSGGTFEPLIRTNNATNKFWVGQTGYSGAPNRYASVSSTGVISPIVSFAIFAVPSTIRAVAALNNESHLLVIPNAASINNIHKWNLTTLAWDGTIGPVTSGFHGNDLLVMSDDTIITVYESSDYKNNMIKRYNLSGTELNTVTVTTTVSGSSGPRLGYAADPLYFWLWLPLSDGNTLIKKYKVSDFSVVIDQSIRNVYETSIETLTPELIYVSDSCPIIETRVAGNGNGGNGGNGGTEPGLDIGGIYFINPAKAHDTYYTSEKKIPDPTIKTALIGE